jgi:hypothetical protein
LILDRLHDYVVATALAGGEGPIHLARYPSPQWNVQSWSYRLVEDLRLMAALHRSRLRESALGRAKLRLAARLAEGAYSYHHDATYKALLFTLLQRHAQRRASVLVLPEVGPFGFDLLIARCAGFSRFVAYDKDTSTVETCRAFHSGVAVEYSVSSTAAFDFAPFRTQQHLIVFPDWPHDELARRLAGFDNVLQYSFRADQLGLRQAQRRLAVDRPAWQALFEAMDTLERT